MTAPSDFLGRMEEAWDEPEEVEECHDCEGRGWVRTCEPIPEEIQCESCGGRGIH